MPAKGEGVSKETRESGWDEVSVMHGRHAMLAGSSFLSPVLTTATGPDAGESERKILYGLKSVSRQYLMIKKRCDSFWRDTLWLVVIIMRHRLWKIAKTYFTWKLLYTRGKSVVDSCIGGGDGLQEKCVVWIRSLVLNLWTAKWWCPSSSYSFSVMRNSPTFNLFTT